MLCLGRARIKLILTVSSVSSNLLVCAEEVIAHGIATPLHSYVQGNACQMGENEAFPAVEEMTRLELLQVDLRLQSNSVASTISSIPRGKKRETIETVVSESPSIARTGKEYDIVAVDKEGEIEHRWTQPSPALAHTKMSATSLPSASASVEFPLDLREELTPNEVHHHFYTTRLVMRMKRFIASLCEPSDRPLFITVTVLTVLSCLTTISVFVFTQRPKPPEIQEDTPRPFVARGGDFPSQPARSPLGTPVYVSKIDSREMEAPKTMYSSPPQAPIPSVVSSSTMRVPPICPALILKETRSRFMIPIHSLSGTSLDILGTSGGKLLHCEKSTTNEGRPTLTIATTGMERDPNAIVLGPSYGDANETYDILGKGRVVYGKMESASGGGFILQCQGRTVMSVETGSDLRMTAHSMTGYLVASAEKGFARTGQEVWNIAIEPNTDAVLISACMLAPLLLAR